MSIIKVTDNDVSTFTLVTTPRRQYISSSSGVTGSVKVYPRRSSKEKDTDKSFAFNDTRSGPNVDANFDTTATKLKNLARSKRASNSSILNEAESYVKLVSDMQTKATDVLDVERFTPTTRFTKYTMAKTSIKDLLMPYYRTEIPHAHWAYTNYHTLNFFTAFDASGQQLVPTSSVLLYPNSTISGSKTTGYASGSYVLTGPFSFDFHVNPRYNEDGLSPGNRGHYRAGTLVHLSSSYAISIVSGSQKDYEGRPVTFRVQLQLSHSADIPPSQAIPGSYPNDLVFLSDDYSLNHKGWHHVVIRWGTNSVNSGTGSFYIDGINRGDFVVPSSSVALKPSGDSLNPDVLCVGNFYEGTNYGTAAQSMFFAVQPARREGVDQLTNDTIQSEPDEYYFRHPLKAEIHNLQIKRYYMSAGDISNSMKYGPSYSEVKNKNRTAFYLPPYFVEATPIRRYVGDRGGILQTPFFAIDGTTDDPFNVALAFGVNGHYINLENFTKDFATGRFPRLLCLSGTAIDHTTEALEANTFLYADPGVAKRNLTILPCDDGTYEPNFEFLSRERHINKYKDPYGNTDYSYINLDNLVTFSSSSADIGKRGEDGKGIDKFINDLIGPSPETPGRPPGPAYQNYIAAVNASLNSIAEDEQFNRGVQKGVPLTILQRTLDPSSNQITIFNISNLYYGKRILPGSFMMRDSGMSGSFGCVPITLRDDKQGNIYRADSTTPHYTENTVGNIFYDEGIVVIKNPHLYFFGKNQYEMTFKGTQNVYSTKYEILASPGLLNSSSNETYQASKASMRPSGSPIDKETFVYISGLYFHDENMNVVAKAKLAQPVMKREGDKILFKVGFDF